MQSSERPIGFSTGALALGDWKGGIYYNRDLGANAIELSTLRYGELGPFVERLDEVDVTDFNYVSLHLPSSYQAENEHAVLAAVEKIAGRGWPLILHPDVIADWSAWKSFGALVCIENMDKRKPVGRTVE